MNRISKAFFLALALLSLPLAAQEAGEPEATPAPASEAEAAAEQAAEREELEPSVPSAVLAQDVRRRATGGGAVMDEMELGRTEITGNQELPKVLYIVPWKKSDPGDLMSKPVNTLLDEVLAPLDREEFIRQVGYYDDLYKEAEE
jgi:hypothetical protein